MGISVHKWSLAALTAAWGVTASASAPSPTTALVKPRAISSPLLGVTVDSIDDLPQIVESLGSLCRMPTTRIVFDEVGPDKYATATREIHEVSFVMGELLDSYFVKKHNVRDYVDRARRYVGALGPWVDIWEVGNEVNGQWLGDTPSVIAKVGGAYDVVKATGGRTALTLYHDESSDGMLEWAEHHVPDRLKEGLDYVFVSFYEDHQGGIKPDWQHVFARLTEMFPHAQVGFGEVGTEYRRFKPDYIRRYYGMQISQPNFAGGYFWWYYKQDMVPRTKPLHAVLNQAAAAGTLCRDGAISGHAPLRRAS